MTKPEVSDMHSRRILLRDGRYLIFYTFDDAHKSPLDDNGKATELASVSPLQTETTCEATMRRED
jgi:hypothetical protein